MGRKMTDLIPEHLINDWSAKDWIAKKKKLSDCVWITGAILKHELDGLIYIAPAPTVYGVIFEFELSSIVEVVETGQISSFLDKEYIISRIYLNKKSIGKKISWCIANDLPADFEHMQ